MYVFVPPSADMLYLDFARDGLGDAEGRVNDTILTVGMGMSDTEGSFLASEVLGVRDMHEALR